MSVVARSLTLRSPDAAAELPNWTPAERPFPSGVVALKVPLVLVAFCLPPTSSVLLPDCCRRVPTLTANTTTRPYSVMCRASTRAFQALGRAASTSVIIQLPRGQKCGVQRQSRCPHTQTADISRTIIFHSLTGVVCTLCRRRRAPTWEKFGLMLAERNCA